MGKAPRKPKPKTKPDAPGAGHNSGNTKPPLTADERRMLFLQHREGWVTHQARRKVLDKAERELKAALKADGFKVKMMQIADELADLKGEAKVKSEVEDRLQVARWIGHPMGAQLDLFDQPDRVPIAESAYDAGKMASMSNQPAKPPHAPETEAYREYMAGYHDHQRQLAGGLRAPRSGDQSTMAYREETT